MIEALSIAELADVAGISARAVRFYVQQKLLPPPEGRGRGSHYTPEHRQRLERVIELQRAGHSLDAIRQILEGRTVDAPVSRPRPTQTAELWTRLRIADGIELSFDATRRQLSAEDAAKLRQMIREAFGEP